MKRKLMVLFALAGAACGRTTARDSGVDSGRAGEDAASFTGSPDAQLVPARFACSALAPQAAKGPFTSLVANQVLFAEDRSLLVVQGKRAGTDQGNEVVVVHLPDGETTPIASRVFGTQWLVPGESLLLETVDKDLLAASLDGSASKTLAKGSFDHTLSPNGKRLFSFGGCQAVQCTLDAIDTTNGATTRLSDKATTVGPWHQSVVFSPNGKFLAFAAEENASDTGRNAVLHVVDQTGRDYAIASQPGVSYPAFVSDELLIFLVRTSASGFPEPVELRGHVPGSGDRSTLIATGYDFQPHEGYDLSRDRRWILGAKSAGVDMNLTELAAISLEGGATRVLAKDLFASWSTSMPVDMAGFVGDEHVVYVAQTSPTALCALATVPLPGGAPRTLGPSQSYLVSPVGERVAFSEYASSVEGLHVVDLNGPQEICLVSGNRKKAQAFLPDGRGLLFEDYGNTGFAGLFYLSLPGCIQTTLAPPDPDRADGAMNSASGLGGVDPTSCFALVRSQTGTSLVLLPP